MANYGRYQGRKPSGVRTFLKGLAIALVILLVILGGAVLFLQEYLVYGDDGIRLELPWSSDGGQASPSPPPVSSPPVLITDDGTDDEPSPSQSEPLPPVVEEPLHAVWVSQTVLLAGAAPAEVEAAGGNAVVVTMKNDDGSLNYVSAIDLAIEAGASGSDIRNNNAIEALTAGEMYTIAMISCFRDHALPSYSADLALRTNSGYRFDDHQDVRWTSPYIPEVRDYLTAVCVELAGMGFDEILLTNCGYPAAGVGNLGWIRPGDAYPVGALDGVLLPFLEQVSAALEPFDVKLSVLADAGELMGVTANTGLTMANVLATCDRFWVDAAQAAAYANFASADGETDPSELLVVLYDTAGAESIDWAILG